MSILGQTVGKLKQKSTYDHFFQTLKYSLYVISHPLDGTWDLTHENRGSIAAANFIVILTLFTRIWRLQFTSFQFIQVYWENVNIFLQFASVLLPLVIWCVGNWGLTTLFDGKGTMKKIYMGTAYALTPYPLIQIPLIFFSNVITVEEGAFYSVFSQFSIIWAALLIIAAMMQIHEYSLGKTIACIIASIAAMMVIVFILLLFFSLISDGVAYFVSLYEEFIFRLY